MPNLRLNVFYIGVRNYRKLTELCQTNASNKNRIGIAGNTSINGLKMKYVPGNFDRSKQFSITYY